MVLRHGRRVVIAIKDVKIAVEVDWWWKKYYDVMCGRVELRTRCTARFANCTFRVAWGLWGWNLESDVSTKINSIPDRMEEWIVFKDGIRDPSRCECDNFCFFHVFGVRRMENSVFVRTTHGRTVFTQFVLSFGVSEISTSTSPFSFSLLLSKSCEIRCRVCYQSNVPF